MSENDDDPIAEAITEHWGERCPDFDADCPCCKAWIRYDVLMGIAVCSQIEDALVSPLPVKPERTLK